MYVRVMGVRETQCEYCDAAGGVEPGAVCRRTFEEKRWKMRGYSSVMLSDTAGMDKDEVCIRLEQAADTAGLKKEGFTISTRGNMTTVTGNDGSGVIYGCRELIDHVGQYKDLKFPAQLTDAPEWCFAEVVWGFRKWNTCPERGV